MVFKLVGNGLKAPLVGAAAFNAIKNVQLRDKLAAKYEDIRDTHDDMIASFKANKPEKEKQGIDLFLQLSSLIKEYDILSKQLADKTLQSKVAAVLGPIIENHGKIKETLDILASENVPGDQGKEPETVQFSPVPVEISEQPEPAVKKTKPAAKPSFARLATKALAKAADASEWISQGKALMASGDVEPARNCFAKAVELAPWSADALFYHGSACFQTGDMHGAQKSLEAAVGRYKKALEKPVLQDRPDILKAMQANVVASVEMLGKIVNPAIGAKQDDEKQVLESEMDVLPGIDSESPIPMRRGKPSMKSSNVAKDHDAKETPDDVMATGEPSPGKREVRGKEKTREIQEINFACPGCSKFYRIKDPDVNLVYACSECGAVLNRVFKCPHCKQSMALPQDQFKVIVNIEIPCVYCNEPFNP